jgi:hypothetical protein
MSKWPLYQRKEKVKTNKESPTASLMSFVNQKEPKYKKKKTKFDFIPLEEKEPTLKEFLQMNSATEYPVDKEL